MSLSESRTEPLWGYWFPHPVGWAASPTLTGFPGSSTDLSTRAALNHPGRSSRCLPVASLLVSGFILVGGLATFDFLTRPNQVYLHCGSRVRPYQGFAKICIAPLSACWATCPNRQFTRWTPFSSQDQPGLSWRTDQRERFFAFFSSLSKPVQGQVACPHSLLAQVRT